MNDCVVEDPEKYIRIRSGLLRGSRSLRWDLITARVPKGVLHAKVSLLCWSNAVRLIIASANLTEDGYRLNREIFGVLDYRNGEEAPLSVLTDTVGFLLKAISFSEPTIPAVQRWETFLNSVLTKVSTEWTIIDTNAKRNAIKANVIFVSSDRVSALEQLKTMWPDGSPPRNAYITSPFFDLGTDNWPAREIWELLSQRGEASVTYNVKVAEQTPGSGSFFRVRPRIT